MALKCEKNVLKALDIIDCRIDSYLKVLSKQHKLVEEKKVGVIGDTVLIGEHRPVITLGLNQSKNKLLINTESLKEKDIDVIEVKRGGGITAHNPGQLVFYPILNIKKSGLDINEYIRMLEKIGIDLLGEYNIEASRNKGYPGLWIENRKIASIGVRVSKFVTYHGMAININNDLSIFDYIVPCGIEGITMTSVLKETGIKVQMDSVKKSLSKLLYRYFS